LLSFAAEEPSAEEVRSLVPTSQFLMSFSQGPKFDVASDTTHDGVTRFLNNFESKYMIQKKFAHLGPMNLDIDGRVSARVGDPRSKVRIEPVHAGATEKSKPEAPNPEPPKPEPPKPEPPKPEPPKPEEPKPEGPNSDDSKPTNDTLKTENVLEKEVKIPKSWKVNRFAARGFFPADDEEEAPPSNAAEQGKGDEDDMSSFSKARSEPEDQQNVPLASVSRAQTLSEGDEIAGKPVASFGKRFISNPWKT
jgi:hypothetical protein